MSLHAAFSLVDSRQRALVHYMITNSSAIVITRLDGHLNAYQYWNKDKWTFGVVSLCFIRLRSIHPTTKKIQHFVLARNKRQ